MEQIKKAYIDANVFIAAALENDAQAQRAREILRDIQSGKLDGYSSVLSIDEVFYKIMKVKSREQAIEACESLLSMRGLHFIDATKQVLIQAMRLLDHSHLLPRDAIHVASMRAVGASRIISADADFDEVEGIKREKM